MQEYMTIPHQNALAFTQRILQAHGVSPTDAATVADNLVSADLRGVDSHGINRLPSYLQRVRQGVLDPKAQPTLNPKTPVVALMDGHNAFGAVVARQAMTAAVSMATTYGIGMVSCKRSNHFGISAWVVQQAVDAGMMALVFTNSSPALPAWGGKEQLLGVSPIACGAPGAPIPFVLDMAPSVAARGKIYKALRRGEQIPEDWALDGQGNPTTDPKKALEGGVMLPMGGPKGSALAIMMWVCFFLCVRPHVSPSAYRNQQTNQGRILGCALGLGVCWPCRWPLRPVTTGRRGAFHRGHEARPVHELGRVQEQDEVLVRARGGVRKDEWRGSYLFPGRNRNRAQGGETGERHPLRRGRD